jgi:hypothetical protein
MEQATDINTRTAMLTEPDTATDTTLTNPSQIHSKKLNSKITIECKTEEVEKMNETPKASILLSQPDETQIPKDDVGVDEISDDLSPRQASLADRRDVSTTLPTSQRNMVTILPSSQRTILTKRPTTKKI